MPVAGSCDLGPVEGMGALMLWKGNVCVLGSAWFVPAPWGAFSTSSAGLHSPSITVVVVLFWKLHLSFFLSKYEHSLTLPPALTQRGPTQDSPPPGRSPQHTH